jgi:hypothetical protein
MPEGKECLRMQSLMLAFTVNVLLIGLGTFCAVRAQEAPPVSIEQSLASQYPIGTLVVVHSTGIAGVNTDCTQPNTFTYKGGQLHAPSLLQKLSLGLPAAPCASRPFSVASKAMVTSAVAVARVGAILINLAQCDGCDAQSRDQRLSAAASGSVFRAQVLFQFPKGYLVTAAPDTVQAVLDHVFTLDTSANAGGAGLEAAAPQGVAITAPAAVAGSLYVSSQNIADKLKLNTDNSFLLQEGGQAFSGTYGVNGAALTLHITQLGRDVAIAIQGNTLIVNGQEVWIQQSASNAVQPSQSISQLVGAYFKAGNSIDRLQLNADSSFSLQERGHRISGSFQADGSRLILKSPLLSGASSIATISDDRIVDDEQQVWVRKK